jgi:hypothetical protein
LTNECAWNAVSAFANCGLAVAHVRGSYVLPIAPLATNATYPPKSRMQFSFTLMSSGSKSNRTSWSLSSPTQKVTAASGSKAVTSYRCLGARHRPLDVVRFSCPTLRNLKTPVQFALKTVRFLSHQLRGGAAGSANSLPTPLRLHKASPGAWDALRGRST